MLLLLLLLTRGNNGQELYSLITSALRRATLSSSGNLLKIFIRHIMVENKEN